MSIIQGWYRKHRSELPQRLLEDGVSLTVLGKIRILFHDKAGSARYRGLRGLFGARNVRACLSPLHAEMEVLIWAMESMKNLRQFRVTSATDCSQLMKMVSEPEE